MTRVLWIALAAVVSCGHPAPAPAPLVSPAPAPVADAAVETDLDKDLPKLASRSTQMYQEVAAAFVAVGEDCAAATAKLTGIQHTYADVMAAIAKVLHDGRARELRAALEPSSEALDAAAKSIVDSRTMHKCSLDRAFTAAFDFIGAPP
jgi:hypothetical protein